MGEWRKDSDVIFERFAAGIDEAISKGEELKCADRDVQYGIKLQNERLKKAGVTLNYNLTPRGHMENGFNLGSLWKDGHYDNKLEARSCKKEEKYIRDGKVIFKKKSNAKLFQTVTDTNSPEAIADDEYICPDCGAVSKVGQLVEGCKSCGNKFKMSELYPKVSNYYFYPDVSSTGKEMAKIAIPSILISIAVSYLPMLLLGSGSLLLSLVFTKTNPYQAMESVSTGLGLILGGGVFAVINGVVIGWIITSVIYLTRFGKFAAQRIPMAKYLGCQREFENYMKKFTPEFSYEFFAGKTISLIKMILYSENPEELPFYNGPGLNPYFKSILDSMSMGCVGINKTEVEGDYVKVYADVYLENTYLIDGKIRRVNEIFKVVMKKNVSKPVDMRFKITSIHCQSCGASFDATKNKICPACGNTYKMEDMDWAVESLTNN